MKIALTADWHFRGKDLAAATRQLRAMITHCEENDVEAVCVAGDIFDKANIHDSAGTTGEIVSAILPLIASSELSWLMIPGNHDKLNETSGDALEVFGSLENVVVTRERGWIMFHDIAVYCLPWDWSGANADDVLSGINGCHDQATRALLLAHVQVAGARLNSFRTAEGGGTWCVSRETLDLVAANFDRICLGDFHVRQESVNGKGGYVGALRQLTHGEEGNPAGFEIWDSEANLAGWVELHEAPRYFTREIANVGDLTAYLHSRKPGDLEKVRFVGGFIPDRSVAADLESSGVLVEHIVEATERVSRVEAVPQGVIEDPIALLKLWASVQQPPLSEEQLAALIDEHNSHQVSVCVAASSPVAAESVGDIKTSPAPTLVPAAVGAEEGDLF